MLSGIPIMDQIQASNIEDMGKLTLQFELPNSIKYIQLSQVAFKKYTVRLKRELLLINIILALVSVHS